MTNMTLVGKALSAVVVTAGAALLHGADFAVSGGDGAAIQQAIDAAAAAGGGRVIVPAGEYPSKTLYLKSRVELHLEKGALIQGGTNILDYSIFGSRESKIGRSLIQAWDAEDIAITGEGAIDGNGWAFFDVEGGLTKFGRHYSPKPGGRALLVALWRCRGVRFRGVSFLNSAVWTMRLRMCEDMDFDGIKVRNDLRFYNADGIDIDSCRHVRVRNSEFCTGDDSIILRAIRGKGETGKFVCEDVEVSDCTLESACQCIRVGCPSDDTIRDCRFRNIRMKGNNGIFFEFPLAYLRQDEEGYANVHNISFENVTGDLYNRAVQIVVGDGIKIRGVRDVLFRNFDVKSKNPLQFMGNFYSPVARIRRENFRLNGELLPDGEFDAPCTSTRPLRRRQPGEYNYKPPVPYVPPMFLTVGEQTCAAIQRAMDEVATNATGGVVIVPEGIYPDAALRLRDRTELRLQSGARILGGKAAVITAQGAENVALTGDGSVESDHGECLVQFERCRGVRLDGVSFRCPSRRGVQIRLCDDVEADGLSATSESPVGVFIDECRHVRTANCSIEITRSDSDSSDREKGASATFPSPSSCVRACPDGLASAKKLWNGIAPQVKEWELGRRAETLKWFEENQFGKTPCGQLPDEAIGETSVSFTNAGIRIDIHCSLPDGADAAHPVPVFLFGDHRGGKKAPDYRQETYEGIPTNSITARGYAYVRWNFNDVCPNVDARNSFWRWPLGIVSYQATGDRTATNVVRAADSWGTIGAWAWGNSRVMDWIESRPELDASRVAVLGHSRGGKTALWTAAQDERFAMAISNGSGCGGARLGRAKDQKAETIRQILNTFPNWFCTAFSAWIDRDAELPHDADDLIRLIAPRLVYVASGSEDAWAGPLAEKAAWDSAHDLYRAYGLEERMGYHCHDGVHKLRADDWEKFMDFADLHLKAPSAADSDAIARRIEAACANGSRTVILAKNAASPNGVWRLTRAIVLPDDFTLVLDGCRVELADGVQDNLVRNAGAREGACEPNRGIRILGKNGAVLSGGRRNHYLPKRSGDPNGWRSVGILLCDVSDYEVGGFAMDETQCWAISQERCCRGRIHDISFGSSDIMFNQDGVDVRKGCHDIVIENISGSTGDDVVALTAYRDPRGSPARYGMQIGGNADLGERDDVYNVTIRNVKARSAGGHGVIRLLVCDGIKMHHITVENVVDTAAGDQKRPQATIRIGDSGFHKTRRCEMGEMHHISIRGVMASGKVAVWVRGPLCDSEIVSVTEAPGGVKYKVDAQTENVVLNQ